MLTDKMSQTKETRWSKPTNKKYLDEAVQLGCIEETEAARGNKAAKYKFVKAVEEVKIVLRTAEEIAAVLESEK